jgi:hypothetical protein
MPSQGLAGGCCGKLEHLHASPIETPSICVRDGGQIAASPSISTDHNVGIDTIGTDDASVVG